MTDKPPAWVEDPYVAILREEVSELAGLPRRFDHLALVVGSRFDLLDGRLDSHDRRLETLMDRILDRLDGHGHRIDDHASQLVELQRHKRITETRLEVLEALAIRKEEDSK